MFLTAYVILPSTKKRGTGTGTNSVNEPRETVELVCLDGTTTCRQDQTASHMPAMTTMQQRKDEILAKKAKLAELKRQRELRQKEFNQSRHSIGDASDVRSSSAELCIMHHYLTFAF